MSASAYCTTTLSCSNSSVSSSDMSSDSSSFHNASLSVIRGTAEDVANEIIEKSTIFDVNAEAEIPKFDKSELALGRVLGRGGFGVIYEITSIKIAGASTNKKSIIRKSSSLGIGSGRRKLKKLHTRDDVSNVPATATRSPTRESMAKSLQKGQAKYVVKQLPEENMLLENKVALLKGTVDLALETKFLAALDHDHIIQLMGVSQAEPFDEGYFIVLPKMQETLTKKFKTWSIVDRASKGITGSLTGGKKKKVQLLVERLQVAHDIANALEYLHGLDIIYRDLKPDNIGFDANGKVTIFDFGLAKQLDNDQRQDDGNYRKMTSFTGAIRYMAPEVGLGRPYNLSADVYSFGMLLWFILALEPPFACYTPEMLPKCVFEKGHRPALLCEWDDARCNLLKSCWHADPKKRPNFGEIQEFLQKQICAVQPDAEIPALQDELTRTSLTESTQSKENKFAARQA